MKFPKQRTSAMVKSSEEFKFFPRKFEPFLRNCTNLRKLQNCRAGFALFWSSLNVLNNPHKSP